MYQKSYIDGGMMPPSHCSNQVWEQMLNLDKS